MPEKTRCYWVGIDKDYIKYHDEEWGVPLYDDHKIFEFLLLETFQAGLSWMTILKKRENFRKAFDGFDFYKISDYSEKKIELLLKDKSIIRNKLKIRSAVSNAKAYIKIIDEFGSFSKYIWKFTGGKPVVNKYKSLKDIPAKNELSNSISKDLKKRGFKFVGSTIIYSHLQATGVINDHMPDCFRYKEVSKFIEHKI